MVEKLGGQGMTRWTSGSRQRSAIANWWISGGIDVIHDEHAITIKTRIEGSESRLSDHSD